MDLAQGVSTKTGREKLCKAHAGVIALPRIVRMGFGDGGMGADGNVMATTGEETHLRNELLVIDIEGYSFPEPTTCRYTARIKKNVLADAKISEQALFDEDGDMVAYKTFLPKGKDADMEFVFDMDEIF